MSADSTGNGDVPARFVGKTFYEILSVPSSATTGEIKKAYRLAALRFHPDHNHTATANEDFAYLAKIHEILSDDKKRKIYDQTGEVTHEHKHA